MRRSWWVSSGGFGGATHARAEGCLRAQEVGRMTLEVAIMFGVAAAFAGVGAWLLAALRRPQSEARVYAYRMTGIMALSGGIVLAMSAALMWQWSGDG
jgi:hypothetical protein